MVVADIVPQSRRREIMQSVRSLDTNLEWVVRRVLWRAGLRYRVHVRNLPGHPDIAIKARRIAIFVDSCFWHGCPDHGRIPKSRVEFWTTKIATNRARDAEITATYQAMNWHIIRIWEHDFPRLDAIVTHIVELMD